MFFFASALCYLIVMFDYPNLHVTETSSSTRCVREVRHVSHRRECTRRMEEEGVVPRRQGGVKGRRVDVEPDVEHQPEQQEYMDLQQEQPDVELQHMEEQELQTMDEKMEDAKPRRRRKKSWEYDLITSRHCKRLKEYNNGP